MNHFVDSRFHNQGARNSAPADCFALSTGRPRPMTGGHFFPSLKFCGIGEERCNSTGDRDSGSDSPPF